MTSLIFFVLATPIVILIGACNRALSEQFAVRASVHEETSGPK